MMLCSDRGKLDTVGTLHNKNYNGIITNDKQRRSNYYGGGGGEEGPTIKTGKSNTSNASNVTPCSIGERILSTVV